MKPKDRIDDGGEDLFRHRLENIINTRHELVRLASVIDWQRFDEAFGASYGDKGRPALPTRLMVGLNILKYMYGLSDSEVSDRWVETPYYQAFCGEVFFRHEAPFDRSSMTRWRKRLGEDKLTELIKESLATAHRTGALRLKNVKRVTVDTTVQPKNITFPTDAKLLYASIVRLGSLCRRHGVKLRQSYVRVGKFALIKAQRYAPSWWKWAKQFKRHRGQVKFLRVRLGRVIRDIRRKIAGNEALEATFEDELSMAVQLRLQNKRQEGRKLYSLHAPETECIGKGKAHKPYEFGCKVSITTTNAKWIGAPPERTYVDKGYVGHDAPNPRSVFRSGQKRGVHGQIKRELRRRSAVEPIIGHLKEEHRLNRNFLKGRQGDCINAILAAAGYNFKRIAKWLKDLLRTILIRCSKLNYRLAA